MSVAVRLMCSDVSQNGSGKAEPQITRAKGLSIKGRTAQIVNGKLVMVDAAGEDATRSLSASPEPLPASSSAAPAEEAPVASTSQASTQSSSSKPPGSRPKLTRRLTRYFCTWEDCAKSYAKPVRLEEHLRSHTGERPYKCSHEGCGASYLRDTHLVAHMRTHLDEKDKPFTCRVDGCEKRFWTNQHLNRHVKLVHEQNSGAYKCEQCDAAFNKHNKLREHVVKEHMPEGTKPFFCPVKGCGKSFQTSSTLRTHSKLHDENRYVCMHPSHLALHKRDPSARDSIATAEPNGDDESNFPHFATWSALQEHNKIEHPPTCPHAECRGRTFKNNKKLRKHCIKFHLETLPQSEEETATAEEEEGGSESAAQESGKIQDAASSHVNLSSKGPSATEDGTGQYTTLDSARDPPLPLSRGSAEPREQNKSSSQVLAGKLRKRNYDGSPSDLLIPTQPNVYGNFDGIDDYDQIEGQQDDEDIVLPANKRVRFA